MNYDRATFESKLFTVRQRLLGPRAPDSAPPRSSNRAYATARGPNMVTITFLYMFHEQPARGALSYTPSFFLNISVARRNFPLRFGVFLRTIKA